MVDAKESYDYDMNLFLLGRINMAFWEPDKLSNLMNPHRAKIFDSIKSEEEQKGDKKQFMKTLRAGLKQFVKKRKKKKEK